MKRDTVKTLAGLLIIGVIVVATFMYGNAQRQAQLKHDQEVKKQQEAKAGAAVSKTLPSASAAPSSPSNKTATNTAPVQSPGSNSIQGSATASQAPKPASGQVAGSQTASIPNTGPLPETGAPIMGIVGVTAVIGSALALRRSKRALVAAARK